MTYLILIAVLLVFGLSFALIFRMTRSERARHISQLANHLQAEYRQFAALDRDVRDAGFHLIAASQLRHGRHQIHGEISGRTFKTFDFACIHSEGLEEQTLIIVDTRLDQQSDFSVMTRAANRLLDHFTDAEAPILPKTNHGLGKDRMVTAATPHRFELRIEGCLKAYLADHPGLCIEHRQHMLMVFKPALRLEPSALEAALNSVVELAKTLESD